MNSHFDILLVEDDPIVRCLLAEALRIAGYSVLIASGGRIALGLLAQHAFDAVVTDVLMPQVDGFEMIMHLRGKHPSTRILAMSGGGRVGDAHTLLRAAQCLGAHRTLEKPFPIDTFIDAIRALVRPPASATAEQMTEPKRPTV